MLLSWILVNKIAYVQPVDVNWLKSWCDLGTIYFAKFLEMELLVADSGGKQKK